MNIYPKLITEALEKVRYPGTGKNIVEAGMVDDNIRIDGNKVSFTLIFEKETDPFKKSVVRAAEASIKAYVSQDVEVTINTRKADKPQAEPEPAVVRSRRNQNTRCCRAPVKGTENRRFTGVVIVFFPTAVLIEQHYFDAVVTAKRPTDVLPPHFDGEHQLLSREGRKIEVEESTVCIGDIGCVIRHPDP